MSHIGTYMWHIGTYMWHIGAHLNHILLAHNSIGISRIQNHFWSSQHGMSSSPAMWWQPSCRSSYEERYSSPSCSDVGNPGTLLECRSLEWAAVKIGGVKSHSDCPKCVVSWKRKNIQKLVESTIYKWNRNSEILNSSERNEQCSICRGLGV